MNKKTFQYGEQTVTLETGRIARQADAAVLCSIGDTVVLVTVVASKTAKENQSFFPLTVNYQEKTYAAGRIPGGYFKREGRPTEKETLTCRLIDRPIRPLFPKGFMNEVQVIATVMSLDPEIDPDIPALIGTSAALALSGIPFAGPIAAARVGYRDGNYLINPTYTDLETSMLDLVVAGTKGAVLMVESEAQILSEEIMLGAVVYGHQQMQVVIDAISELEKEAGKAKWEWQAPAANTVLIDQVKAKAEADVKAAYQIHEKADRNTRLGEIRQATCAALCAGDESTISESDVKDIIHAIEYDVVRDSVLAGNPRIDGRDTKTVRNIMVEVGVLPRTHGSALFTRGETQAVVVTTLGSERDAQLIDALEGDYRDKFMLHYNFPPYSVGECGFLGGPKRREIGHGRLARRGVSAVLPSEDDFPYTIRIVSEITESNGSSSMASVCGSSLSMMDAGVPLLAPVAGIAMGLIKKDEKFQVLTDILGDEDHLGDMDFKVAGTEAGITALQMDIKIDGITEEIMNVALAQARDARLHILGKMNAVLQTPRTDVSEFAPRILTIKIKEEKIRDVIGKGGATIRALTEETGVNIDIDDDGTIKLSAVDLTAAEEAKRRIEEITADAVVGVIYEGKVARITDFGAFVTILPGKDGLLHVSQMAEGRVENVSDHLSEGEMVNVKVIEIDRMGRIRLSRKDLIESNESETA